MKDKSMSDAPTSKISSKLTQSQLEELQHSLEKLDYRHYTKILTEYPVNYKSINQIKSKLDILTNEIALRWGLQLMELGIIHKIVGTILLEKVKIWKLDRPKTTQLINELAIHGDWRIRKASIDLLNKAIISDFDAYKNVFVEFITSENPFNRRIAISVAKEIACMNEKHSELKQKVLKLISPIIYEQNPYVITIASDTFANGFLKYYAKETNLWIQSKATNLKDEYAITSLISIYSEPTVSDNIDEALSIIEKFIFHTNEKIKNARSSTLRQIARNDPKKLTQWLESQLHIQQIVEHWAELISEGLLQSDSL